MKIVVADGLRPAVRHRLEAFRDVQVVGEASGPVLTEALVFVVRPDLVLVDVQASGGAGVETARQLRHSIPGLRVLVLGGPASRELVRQAAGMGSLGAVLEGASPDLLLEVIREAAEARRRGVLDLTDARVSPGAGMPGGRLHEPASGGTRAGA